jgi:Sulfotransferase domain
MEYRKSPFRFLWALFILLGSLCHADDERMDLYPPSLPSKEEWSHRVYLATYPRSGNHWVRYLIEEATHIATSSVYCDGDVDKSHLGTPFPWGGYCPKYGYEGHCRYPAPDDIVVVKTHYPAVPAREFDRLPYAVAVRIVRHPIDSLYSFYLFDRKGKEYPMRIPADLLHKRIKTWKKFHEHWNKQPDAITVRYEDFLERPREMLKTILEVMGYDLSRQQIDRAVDKYPPRGHPMKHIHRFEAEDLELIHRELGDLMKQFNYTIP